MEDKNQCGFKTTKGGLCRKVVSFKGEKCHLHADKSQMENIRIPFKHCDFLKQIEVLTNENLELRQSQRRLAQKVSFLEDQINKLLTGLGIPLEESPISSPISPETFDGPRRYFERKREEEWAKEANQALESMVDHFLPS